MPPSNLDEQLTKYLGDAHAIERQALVQMETAPKLAGDPEIAQAFSDHLAETKEHERLIRERLRARDASPSLVKDLGGAVTGKGFGLFAAAQPDTPGKLVAHAYSYEHMEEAAYALLADVATRAEDPVTQVTARRIEQQEHDMGERLAGLSDRAVEASLRDIAAQDLGEQLANYLADAHAIEQQSLRLLDKASALAVAPDLASVYQEHREETGDHLRLIAARLDAYGDSPSKIKDAALRIGALNWGAFFAAQPDTPAKLAAFLYAVEHLEISAYELLRRVAERAGDFDTAHAAERILAQERVAAQRIRSLFDQAIEATLSVRDLA
jgi:ferritin-like metal-binding protein YciE